jgi:hypothetical protein
VLVKRLVTGEGRDEAVGSPIDLVPPHESGPRERVETREEVHGVIRKDEGLEVPAPLEDATAIRYGPETGEGKAKRKAVLPLGLVKFVVGEKGGVDFADASH